MANSVGSLIAKIKIDQYYKKMSAETLPEPELPPDDLDRQNKTWELAKKVKIEEGSSVVDIRENPEKIRKLSKLIDNLARAQLSYWEEEEKYNSLCREFTGPARWKGGVEYPEPGEKTAKILDGLVKINEECTYLGKAVASIKEEMFTEFPESKRVDLTFLHDWLANYCKNTEVFSGRYSMKIVEAFIHGEPYEDAGEVREERGFRKDVVELNGNKVALVQTYKKRMEGSDEEKETREIIAEREI